MSDKLHPTRTRTPGAKRDFAKKKFLSSLASAIERAESETSGVGTVTAVLKYDANGGIVDASVNYNDLILVK